MERCQVTCATCVEEVDTNRMAKIMHRTALDIKFRRWRLRTLWVLLAACFVTCSLYSAISSRSAQFIKTVKILVDYDARDYQILAKIKNFNYSSLTKSLTNTITDVFVNISAPASENKMASPISNGNMATDVTSDKPRILLYSKYRSGSSFIGDIFKSNPDIWYIFEPFRLIAETDRYPSKEIAPKTCHFISMLLNCKTFEFYNEVEQLFPDRRTLITTWMMLTKGVYTRYYRDAPDLDATCMNYKATALKTIRGGPLRKVDECITSGRIKTIVLERDPRGLISSRLELKLGARLTTDEFRNKSAETCQKSLDNLNFLEQKCGWHWQNMFSPNTCMYKLVRYEDVALDPLQEAAKIYDYIGMPFREEVKLWVRFHTSSGRSDGIYGTSRDSNKNAHLWREKLSWEEIVTIQESCGTLMGKLGYNIIPTKDLQKSGNFSVMRPLND